MGKKSRDKGGRGQRAVAKLLSEWWGADFTSTPMSGGFATKKFRDEWNAAADIVTPDPSFPFSVEVKHQEEVVSLESLLDSNVSPVWKWWKQCVDESPPSMIPLLVFKRNRKPWFYMMWLRDWQKHCVDAEEDYEMMLVAPGNGEEPLFVVIGQFSNLLKTKKDIWKKRRKNTSRK